MRIDHAKWRDSFEGQSFMNADGHLTDFAKELMVKFECYTLEDLLDYMDAKGIGFWYKNDTNRPDVGVRGHYSESLSGKFGIGKGGREDDDWDAVDADIKRDSEYQEDTIARYDDMYYVNGKWSIGRTLTKK